jgi:hypothetical protein
MEIESARLPIYKSEANSYNRQLTVRFFISFS